MPIGQITGIHSTAVHGSGHKDNAVVIPEHVDLEPIYAFLESLKVREGKIQQSPICLQIHVYG